ncbi:MAG TPA: hypothetical protein VGE93_04725, partial [Bryobacteraceae bacterium]
RSPPRSTSSTATRTAAHCRIELYQIKAALPRRRRPAASRACGLAAGPGRGDRLSARRLLLVSLGLSGRRWTCWRTPLVQTALRSVQKGSVVALVRGHLAVPACATMGELHMPHPLVV